MKIKKKTSFSVDLLFSKYQEFPRPKFTDKLKFPEDVTLLSGANVSELLSKYTQLYVYANAEVCKCNIRILRLETQESLLKAQILTSSPSLNAQERWRRDTVLDCNPEIRRFRDYIDNQRQLRAVAETARDNFDRYVSALSRELSRKGYEHRTT